MSQPERLACVAIIRNGVTHHEGGWHEHWKLRAAIGDEQPHERQLGDEEGYWTDADRFVDRTEAWHLALASGQTRTSGGRLLSCDVEWEGQRPKQATSERKTALTAPRRRFRP